jgi:VanZ family protein
MGVIFYLSSLPTSSFDAADKATGRLPETPHLVHGVLYFVLAFLIARALGRGNDRGSWRPAQTATYAAVAVAASFLYGVSDEFHQEFVEGRGWSEMDLVEDLLGASASAASWVVWRRWRSRPVLHDLGASGATQPES